MITYEDLKKVLTLVERKTGRKVESKPQKFTDYHWVGHDCLLIPFCGFIENPYCLRYLTDVFITSINKQGLVLINMKNYEYFNK